MPTPPRRRLVGFSSKMYFSLDQTTAHTRAVLAGLAQLPPALLRQVDIFLLPDFVSLAAVTTQVRAAALAPAASAAATVWTGAQDCHPDDYGSLTGEVSAAVLRSAGAHVVAVGHAERRRLFHETDALVARKAAAVSRNGMVPLVCVGETTRPCRDDGGDVAQNQTAAAAADLAVEECRPQIEAVAAALAPDRELVLAYEPVWAIGAARPADEAHVLAVVRGLRALECVRRREAGTTRIVYGGSAGPGLYARLSTELDGLFLGRFAHDPERFVQTVREVAEA